MLIGKFLLIFNIFFFFRDIDKACEKNILAQKAWYDYHNFIEIAKRISISKIILFFKL